MNTFKLTQFKAKTNIEKKQGRIPRHYKTMRIGLVLAAMMFGGVFYGLATMHTPETEAIEPSSFNAGYLIDDSVFYNPNTMTVAEIQKLLDDKSPACDMWGTGLISGRKYPDGTWVPAGTTRAQYAKVMREKYGNTKYHDPPYVCINKYYENPETHQSLYETQGVATAGMKSAAQIIYDVAQEYSINPQVLLVMIKKESLVWGDNWPLKYEYNTVMGYGCPDNAPCNEAYYGFYNQVQKAAWQLKYYREHPTSYRYKSGQMNNIQYHPNTYCGTKQVYLENIATTSLYIYTPYTPNDAALRAYPGTGDGCSSYGNRNFYMFFREWFGDSSMPLNWQESTTARFLTTTENAQGYDFDKHEVIYFDENESYYFTSKTMINDRLCVRSEQDEKDNINRCIFFDNLNEYSWIWEPSSTPRILKLDDYATIINIRTLKSTGVRPDKYVFYNQKTMLPNGDTCLKNTQNADDYCVLFSKTSEVDWGRDNASWQKSARPRLMTTTSSSKRIDLLTNEVTELEEGITYYFSSKITTQNGLCVRNLEDKLSDRNTCILFDTLDENIGGEWINSYTPRELVVTEESIKVNLSGLIEEYSQLKEIIYFDRRLTLPNGDLCVRNSSTMKENQCFLFETLKER